MRFLRTCADGVAGLLLAAIFATFLLQIFSRYVLASPLGWTLELCLTLWVWLVFWGAAFVVRDRDHIAFDILYLAAPRGARRVMAGLAAIGIAVAFLLSLLPTWEWIDFLRIKPSPMLQIPLRDVFSIYLLFVVAVAVRYGIVALRAARGTLPDRGDARPDDAR